MSQLGQTATSWGVCVTVALPPKAEIRLRCNICRNGPEADITGAALTRDRGPNWRLCGCTR
jgi:hypothetical protein